MYKITLRDYNRVSCTSGTTEFFADHIETFQKEWFRLEKSEERKECFKRSLAGEIVTDYYPTDHDEELNIVQEDKNAKILYRETLEFDQFSAFNLTNSYGWSHIILTDHAKFWFRGIRFQDKYYLVGRYKLKGVSSIMDYDAKVRLTFQPAYGNRVVKTGYKSKYGFDRGEPLYDATDIENYKDDRMESICYIPILCVNEKEKLKACMDERYLKGSLDILMRDIPGEAG